jgi:hypothetical protein
LSNKVEKECKILDSKSEDSKSEDSLYVINPIHINKLDIDINKLKIMVNEYMIPRIEYYKSTETKNLEIESGFSEWWIEKTSNSKKISSGNCPFDVLTLNKNAIDVMCLCINGNMSNEKSIIQNFTNSGNNLDDYFNNKNFDNAIKIFLNEYKKKIINFKNEQNVNKLYYLSFISTSKNVYLSSFIININKLKNVISGGTTKQQKSILIQNFINNKYGNVKLYKSKKRIELRFTKEILNMFNTIPKLLIFYHK